MTDKDRAATFEEAVDTWYAHDGWEFADRESAYNWFYQAGLAAGRGDAEPAMSKYIEHGVAEEVTDPIEQLRAFLSFALRGQDWVDVERFIDALPRGDAEPATTELSFSRFRAANVARCLKWHPEGIDSWSPSDWLTAVTGELGELASLLKMRNRERDGLVGNKFSPTDKQVADELADVLTYLDLLAEVLDVDLGKAAAEKFNEISVRNGFPDRIELHPAPARVDAEPVANHPFKTRIVYGNVPAPAVPDDYVLVPKEELDIVLTDSYFATHQSPGRYWTACRQLNELRAAAPKKEPTE